METNIAAADRRNFFEIKESRKKFLFLGCGASIVGAFLLAFTPRFFSVVTLIGALILGVGLLMIYKGFNIKTLLIISREGIQTRKQGLILWENIETYSFDNVSKSAVFSLQCKAPHESLLIDLSMSDLNHIRQIREAIDTFAEGFEIKEESK